MPRMGTGQDQVFKLHKGDRLPMPIAAMPPWFFWSTPYALGLGEDDALAIDDGSADENQRARAFEASRAAYDALFQAEAAVPMLRRPS